MTHQNYTVIRDDLESHSRQSLLKYDYRPHDMHLVNAAVIVYNRSRTLWNGVQLCKILDTPLDAAYCYMGHVVVCMYVRLCAGNTVRRENG